MPRFRKSFNLRKSFGRRKKKENLFVFEEPDDGPVFEEIDVHVPTPELTHYLLQKPIICTTECGIDPEIHCVQVIDRVSKQLN